MGQLTPTVTLKSGSGTCQVTFTVTATDTCGNTTSQDVTVKVDGTAPSLTIGQLASCYASEEAAQAAITAASTATDNCDGQLTPTVTLKSGSGTCQVTFTVTATDTCGNTTSQDVTVKVDGTAPSLTIGQLASCYASEEAAQAAITAASTATDNCDGQLTPTVTLKSGSGTCQVTFTVTATDTCGNTTSQDVTVKVDGTAPSLTIGQLASCYASEEAAQAAITAASTATDNCDGQLTPTVTLKSGSGTCQVTFTVTATDTCGNTTSQDVTVKVDGTAPSLTIGQLASCYASEEAAQAAITAVSTATDNCDGQLTPTVTLKSGSGTCQVTFTVTATDTCGNTTSQDVTVKVDGTAPSLTIGQLASCYASEEAAQAAIATASTATDNCDGQLTPTVTLKSGSGTCQVTFTVTATDTCGNTTSQDVTVKVDGTAPSLTIGQLASCYASEEAAQAAITAASTATDNCDGPLTPTVTLKSGSGTCQVTFTVTATDTCGNTTSQDVTVKVDGTAPSLTIGQLASCYASEEAAQAAITAASTATDNCDGPLTPTVTLKSGSGTCQVTFTVTATDTCGNTTSQDVTVKVDGTAPSLTIGQLASCYASEEAAQAAIATASTATDNCDGPLTPTVTLKSGSGTCQVTFTVTATDTCGNTTSQDVVATVDSIPPAITCPGDLQVREASEIPQPPTDYETFVQAGGSASDNCAGSVSISHLGDEMTVSNSPTWFVITRTYQASDSCGNVATCTQTITVHGLAQISGTVSYSTLSSSAYTVSRQVVFKATDGQGTVLKTWTVNVEFVNANGTATGSYLLTDVPVETANLSAKTAWHLRQKLAVQFDQSGQAEVNFQLLGGDLNGSNSVNIQDYAVLRAHWQTDHAVADINGDGMVQLLDYTLLRTNWFKVGDEE
jgi:hypothetical protein